MRPALRIQPNFSCPEGSATGFNYYFQGIEASINQLIEKELSVNLDINQPDYLTQLLASLPCVTWDASKPFGIVSLTCLAPAQNTHGLGRFICDHSSRWLLPGKQLALVHVNSLAFSLIESPDCNLFFHQLLIRVDDPLEMDIVLGNIELFSKQLKLNILTVIHARSVVMQKRLTFEEKKIIIQENLATLLGKSLKEIDRSAFDHTHRFIIKMISEEKVEHFKEAFHSLIRLKPQVFDRDLFNELQDRISNFSDEFIACRDIRHLTRMISYEHLFKKNIIYAISNQPDQRHLSFKLFQTSMMNASDHRTHLAVILAVNFLKENEVFEEKHLFKALQACNPAIIKVKDSFFENKLDKFAKTLYMEIEKKDGLKFSSAELGMIKKNFPSEVKLRIERVYSPIFMPKNEEEVLKNILILSHELEYVHDLPQIHISFNKQTETHICFSLIVLRLLKPQSPPIKTILDNSLQGIRFENVDCKQVGVLRKKYPKEAVVCDVVLEKRHFLRKDFSLDLYQARRHVVINLEKLIGEFRDYNGGIISKQSEALSQLRKQLKEANITNDFLVENYFFSLSPSFMPSILPTITLKKQLSLILKGLENKPGHHDIFHESALVDNHLIVVLGSLNRTFPSYMDDQIERKGLASSNITYFHMVAEEIAFIGYICKIESDLDQQQFSTKIAEALENFERRTQEEMFPINQAVASWEGSLVLR